MKILDSAFAFIIAGETARDIVKQSPIAIEEKRTQRQLFMVFVVVLTVLTFFYCWASIFFG